MKKFNCLNFLKNYAKKFSTINKKESEESIVKHQWDFSKHSLLPFLYMFKFNKDNIGYVLHDVKTKSLIGIDFGEYDISSKVIQNLEKNLNSKLKYIFTTHAHNDHQGGNEKWKMIRGSELKIFCGSNEDRTKGDFISTFDKKLNDLETMTIGDLCIACMYTPGHMKSHVCYIITHVIDNTDISYKRDKQIISNKIPFLFSGDTLFTGSVGKVINGTFEELYDSINKLFYLPNDTLIFCGHEYTIQNLEFNLKLDPENDFIKNKLEWALKTRNEGNFTVGSRLIEEKLYNCFARCSDPYFLKLTNETSPLRSFIKLRKLKDKLSI